MYIPLPYCQKVLPAVYDDSLSYYEVVCKLVNSMNEIIDEFNKTVQEMTEAQFILNDKGEWNAETNYAVHDLVNYNGSSYFALVANTNVIPESSSDWQLLAQKGEQGNSITNIQISEVN